MYVSRLLRRLFVSSDILQAEDYVRQFGFKKRISHLVELFWIFVFLVGLSFLLWAVVNRYKIEANAIQLFGPVLTLGAAIIAYRQWRAARYEVSIDKYYDRLESTNRRLEAVQVDVPEKEDMHAFAELDKLEYVLVKYEYRYISPILAARALKNFQLLCQHRPGFKELAFGWAHRAAYLERTREVVSNVFVQQRSAEAADKQLIANTQAIADKASVGAQPPITQAVADKAPINAQQPITPALPNHKTGANN